MSLSRGFKALIKSNDRHFIELLQKQADLAVQALEMLSRYGPEVSSTSGLLEAIKEVEREGDGIRRVLIDELLRTFATPFDREDLFGLSRTIDDILDAANEAAIELSMYGIAGSQSLVDMAGVLVDGARHIRSAMDHLLEHPAVASEHAVRAKRSENHMDALYHQAVNDLFDSSIDIRQVLKVREIYRHLKSSADRIDAAADDISIIVIKRS